MEHQEVKVWRTYRVARLKREKRANWDGFPQTEDLEFINVDGADISVAANALTVLDHDGKRTGYFPAAEWLYVTSEVPG